MMLTSIGALVEGQWSRIAGQFPHVRLDAFVVMPDHVHGLIEIVEDISPSYGYPHPFPTAPAGTQKGSISAIIQGFKSGTTRVIRSQHPDTGRVWQRGFYERMLRDEVGIRAVRRYIANNPARWIEGVGS